MRDWRPDIVLCGTDPPIVGDVALLVARRFRAPLVVVSEDVWRQIRGREGFRFERLGNRSLKGVGSIDLYVVTLDEALATTSVSNAEEKSQRSKQRKEKIRSIAVLPFADLSAEHDQEHFSDGVAEEILNALSKVGGLHVPARTSCFAFRGATLDAREIGKRLGVETLLDGSIRKAGKRVRISVQLVDASNGYQLWSERFDREIEDIFAIQDEIARSVLESLGLALTEREEFRFLKPTTTNIDADVSFIINGRVKAWSSRDRCSSARSGSMLVLQPPGRAWPTLMSISFGGDGIREIWKRRSARASMH